MTRLSAKTAADIPERPMSTDEIKEWLCKSLERAEQSVRAREQMSECWKGGTNATWDAAGNMHPSTRGRRIGKKERLEISAAQGRIAERCRRDVEALTAIIAIITAEPCPKCSEE